MNDPNALKRKLDEHISRLSEDRLHEVLDFVGYLLQKKEGKQTKSSESPPPEHDPILDLIGMVDVEPFAHNIDEELYGV
jgi:hypothetical protein